MAHIGRALSGASVKPDVVDFFGDHAPPFVSAADRAYFDRQHNPTIAVRKLPPNGGAVGP